MKLLLTSLFTLSCLTSLILAAHGPITIGLTPHTPSQSQLKKLVPNFGQKQRQRSTSRKSLAAVIRKVKINLFKSRPRKHRRDLLDSHADVSIFERTSVESEEFDERDYAAEAFKESNEIFKRTTKTVSNVDAFDILNSYVAEVKVGSGSNAKTYELIVDTGSSVTWVGSGQSFTPTPTSHDQNLTISCNYGTGSFVGEYFTDSVGFNSAPTTASNQGIGVASSSVGFQGVDGILGLGPLDLTYGRVDGVASIKTYIQTLRAGNLIPSAIIGILFQPITQYTGNPVKNGIMTLGGVDKTYLNGSVKWVPVTKVYPSSYYWGFQIDKFTYTNKAGKNFALTSSPVARTGIVDTGTTLLLLPSDAFATYMSAIPGSKVDGSTGLLLIPTSQISKMGNMVITIGGKALTLIPSAQLMPPGIGSQFISTGNYAVSIIGNSGTKNTGDDFTLGMYFLERFYSAYDYSRNRVGFSATKYTKEVTYPTTPTSGSGRK